jgi:hypothetical protein
MAPTTPPDRPRAATRGERLIISLALGDWVYTDATWDVSSLWFVEPGAKHCTWMSWDASGDQLGWYINLQEPFLRTDRGFQYMDLMLDVVIRPDGSWRWKDDDEFALMVGRGLISKELARSVRREGESAVARFQAKQPPFCDPWPEWQPDSMRGVPMLPDAWDIV